MASAAFNETHVHFIRIMDVTQSTCTQDAKNFKFILAHTMHSSVSAMDAPDIYSNGPKLDCYSWRTRERRRQHATDRIHPPLAQWAKPSNGAFVFCCWTRDEIGTNGVAGNDGLGLTRSYTIGSNGGAQGSGLRIHQHRLLVGFVKCAESLHQLWRLQKQSGSRVVYRLV